MAPSPASAPASGDCPFLEIPPELRLIIYEQVITVADVVADRPGSRPALLQICRLVRKEACQVFMARQDQYLEILESKKRELDQREKEQQLQIDLLEVVGSAQDLILFVRRTLLDNAAQAQANGSS